MLAFAIIWVLGPRVTTLYLSYLHLFELGACNVRYQDIIATVNLSALLACTPGMAYCQ